MYMMKYMRPACHSSCAHVVYVHIDCAGKLLYRLGRSHIYTAVWCMSWYIDYSSVKSIKVRIPYLLVP